MNLKESIRRILKEETEIPLFLKRRIDFDVVDREFLIALDIVSDTFREKKDKLRWFILDKFRSAIISHMTVELCYIYDDLCNDTNILYYDEMWNFFYEYYSQQMSNRYFEIKHGKVNESVIIEETKNSKIKRRTHLIDNEISRLMDRRFYKGEKICDLYENAKTFVRVVTESVVENLYFNTFHMTDDTSDEWESIVDFIYDYVKDNYGEMLTNRYDKTCKNITCSKCGWSWKLSDGGEDPYTCHKCGNENKKTELTEKCWSGYTQKGMKTMFGKRYPNCVKKTKK